MSRIKIEWVPVKKWKLGLLGFDHLQLVFQQGTQRTLCNQSEWWVIEGMRDIEPDLSHATLGVWGTDGKTTLAQANPIKTSTGVKLPTKNELIAVIGTPKSRGSWTLPFANAQKAWKTICFYADQLDSQRLPYICAGLSPTGPPTINSSSVIASLLYYGGIEIRNNLPKGLRLSPGTKTLIGMPGHIENKIPEGFNAIVTRKNPNIIHGARTRANPLKKIYSLSTEPCCRSINRNHAKPLQPCNYKQQPSNEVQFEFQFPIPTDKCANLTPQTFSRNIKIDNFDLENITSFQQTTKVQRRADV